MSKIQDLITGRRLVIVANAEPYQRTAKQKEERVRGGLSSGLDPLMRTVESGLWISWGRGENDFKESKRAYKAVVPDENGYQLKRIPLSPEEAQKFYLEFSNGCLWPTLHGFLGIANFDRENWRMYVRVNWKYARAILEEYKPGDLIWIQDYHLMLVPQMVREEKPEARIGFFLHTPWPSWNDFRHLPWRKEIVEGLLGSDLIGFHTPKYQDDFCLCLGELKKIKEISSEKSTRTGSFPLGIDYQFYQGDKQTEQKAKELRANYKTEHIIFGLDRMDPTKGILERFKGYELFLKQNPQFHRNITFVQKTHPSRRGLEVYQKMEEEINREVGRVLGRYTSLGDWTPVWYSYQDLPQETLVAHNHISDVALVTPLVDGMNLVAKEWVAGAKKGVLILSEFAGAAEQLAPEALLVNPWNTLQIAKAIKKALEMPEQEKQARLRGLKQKVRTEDLEWWYTRFLTNC